MKIAIVLDQYDNLNNGTTVSAARFVENLRARGHEVRIISMGKPAPDKFVVPTADFGIFQRIITSQGMAFARPDEAVIREALRGVDIVHLYLPFKLCMKTRRIAKEMGIPCMAAFHCQPENVSYNIGMKYFTLLPHLLYYWFYHRFYRYIRDIHCPSAFIADQLKKHGYKARLHVISNGVDGAFRPREIEKPEQWKGKFVIMMVGRLAREKRQDLIIKAVMRSRHKDDIQLVFSGKGPRQKHCERLARKLKNKPVFRYVSKEELSRLYNQCDLYVHAAEAEIEAIVCIEAIASGLVPVIANAKMSAAKQFALDGRSLFKNRNYRDLAEKIDYWIEHPEEKAGMREKYLRLAGEYDILKSIDRIEDLYEAVVFEHLKKTQPKEGLNAHIVDMPTPFVYEVDENYRFVNRNIFFRLGSSLLFYLVASPLMSIAARLFFGLKIVGKRNMRYLEGGAVTVTNHVHFLDSPMVACTLFPRKPFFASLKSNFEIPVVRWLVRILGGIPIPESPKALHAFMESMRAELKKGRIVHFYPEASLWPRYKNLRPFKDGAFHLAVKSNVPVLPMVFAFREAKWPVSVLHKKSLITLIIGKPEYPGQNGSEKERVVNIREAVQDSMEHMLETGPGKKKSAS
jgi:1,2-diacylglycerol 3-alpha-glucosyltransferase